MKLLNIGLSVGAVAAIALQASGQANLLSNPGFEAGDLSGWAATSTATASMSITQTIGVVTPFQGNWFAFLGQATPPLNAIQQTVDISLISQPLRFSAWYQTEDLGDDGIADSAFFRFTYLDGAGAPLGEELFGPLLTVNLQWEQFAHDMTPPAGCEAVRCSIEGTLEEGSFVNVFIDDVRLVARTCPGDIADDFGTLGGDGMVSFGDFLALLGLVGPCPATPECPGDIADDFGTLGGDGQVSFGDFLALLGLVGPCP